jgi:regulator of sirC expression with transglutaminase-like and TPR domain
MTGEQGTRPRETGRRDVSNAAAAVGAAALLVAGVTSCRSAPRPPGPVASALVATAAQIGAPPPALATAWKEIDRVAARVEERHRRSAAPLVDDLTAVLFDELKLEREIDDDDPRFFLLPSVLAARRGSCLGLGAVYLMVAERIGLPLDGVRVPGHFFVRTRDPSPRNIELLRHGETMPDDWYRQKYGPWSPTDRSYLHPLALEQLSALFWFNAGNFARRHGDVARAREAYERATLEAPEFAEAQASLGLARQLEGALPGAEQAYRDAARVRADLPGLDRNMALLERERRSAGVSPSPPAAPRFPTPTPHASPLSTRRSLP